MPCIRSSGMFFHSRIPQSYNIFATHCKYTHRKTASLFSSRTRQICKNRKSIVAVAKSLNSKDMEEYDFYDFLTNEDFRNEAIFWSNLLNTEWL